RAGVVDVPGHEDFVRTMVAGASGIDVVLLVVAADDGIMPQTLEHLAIVEQLGVARGIPVLSKVDLVDAEWAALVAADLAERLARSPVSFTPPIPVSTVTGQGIEELRAALAAVARSVTARDAADLVRLPVDRAFSVAGTGTVVTGTLWSGRIRVGDQVALLPGRERARVRSIEQYGQAVDVAGPGSRTALGLAGVAREAIRRGMVVVEPERGWEEVPTIDVVASLLADAPRPLVSRTRVRLHLGTAEVICRVYPPAPIEPGGSGAARLRLEQPLIARGGDRFILRSFSPVTTIGGGFVVDPMPPGGKPCWSDALLTQEPAARLAGLVARRRDGVAIAEMPILLGATVKEDSGGDIVRLGARLVSPGRAAELAQRALDLVRQFHRDSPTEAGLAIETLRQQLGAPAALVEPVLERLVAARRLVLSDGRARLTGFAPRVPGRPADVERVVALVAAAGLMPPTVAELAAAHGLEDAGAILAFAAASGRVVAVERDRFYAREALDQLVAALREIGASGPITPAAVRDRLGLTRKYVIPLLEWADRAGVTVRVGEGRKLAGLRSDTSAPVC
ncbi:MAG: selenocysteine-specific translation elongation factor, partial [Gemmatimonadota bacterium]